MDIVTIQIEIDTTVSAELKNFLKLASTNDRLLPLVLSFVIEGSEDVRFRVKPRG